MCLLRTVMCLMALTFSGSHAIASDAAPMLTYKDYFFDDRMTLQGAGKGYIFEEKDRVSFVSSWSIEDDDTLRFKAWPTEYCHRVLICNSEEQFDGNFIESTSCANKTSTVLVMPARNEIFSFKDASTKQLTDDVFLIENDGSGQRVIYSRGGTSKANGYPLASNGYLRIVTSSPYCQIQLIKDTVPDQLRHYGQTPAGQFYPVEYKKAPTVRATPGFIAKELLLFEKDNKNKAEYDSSICPTIDEWDGFVEYKSHKGISDPLIYYQLRRNCTVPDYTVQHASFIVELENPMSCRGFALCFEGSSPQNLICEPDRSIEIYPQLNLMLGTDSEYVRPIGVKRASTRKFRISLFKHHLEVQYDFLHEQWPGAREVMRHKFNFDPVKQGDSYVLVPRNENCNVRIAKDRIEFDVMESRQCIDVVKCDYMVVKNKN